MNFVTQLPIWMYTHLYTQRKTWQMLTIVQNEYWAMGDNFLCKWRIFIQKSWEQANKEYISQSWIFHFLCHSLIFGMKIPRYLHSLSSPNRTVTTRKRKFSLEKEDYIKSCKCLWKMESRDKFTLTQIFFKYMLLN